MIYLDTSYIVKAYINEPGSEEVLRELRGRTELVSSQLARLEFTSALMRQRRHQSLTKAACMKALDLLESDTREQIWQWFPIDNEIISLAQELLAHPQSYGLLRTHDAIHIATALSVRSETLYTHDKRMLEAAKLNGLTAIDIIH